MKKPLSLILCTLMLASALTGCASEEVTIKQFGQDEDDEPVLTTKKEESTKAPEIVTRAPETTKAPETTAPVTTAPPSAEQGNHTDPSISGKLDTASLPSGVTKLFEVDRSIYTVTSTAVTYRDYKLGKYGVMSLNGKKYTGAVFADADAVGEYVSVRTKELQKTTSVELVNTLGLLDGELRTVIPCEYAYMKKLGERYIYAIKVTEHTTKKDEAIFYISDSFSLNPAEGDYMFKGNWCVFDLTTGKKVSGATGSDSSTVYCQGDVITWTDKAGKKHMLNAKGEEIPANAKILESGAYVLDGTVYDSDKKKLFTFNTETMSLHGLYEDSERFVGFLLRETKYVILNKKGEQVSEFKFDDFPSVYGNTVISDYIVYDINGKKLMDEEYITAYEAGEYRIFKGNDGRIAVIDTKDNSVIYKAQDPDISVYIEGELFKTVDGKKVRFCFADKDFTISDSDYTYENGLTVREHDGKKEVYDLFTGKTVLDGYDSYTLTEGGDGIVYILVINKDSKRELYIYKR